MLKRMYVVFDTCSGVHDNPWPAVNDDTAIRSFGQAVLDEDHPIGKNPEHFALRFVGIFDDASGVIVPADPVETVVTALELSAKLKPAQFGVGNA